MGDIDGKQKYAFRRYCVVHDNYITDINTAMDVITTATKRGLANQRPACSVFSATQILHASDAAFFHVWRTKTRTRAIQHFGIVVRDVIG